jgi:uncharacterized membrane protein YfcA
VSALRRRLTVAGIGLAAGLVGGLFGVGGGVVLVPGMALLLGVGQHRAHATSLAAMLLIAPAAAVGFALGGEIDVAAAVGLAAGALPGAVAGAAVMRHVSEARLRQGFAVVLLLVAVRVALPGGAVSAVAELEGAPAAAVLVAIGLAVGLLSALMGVGGGLLLVPALVLLLGFTQHAAEGTSLLVIVPTVLVGAWRHSRHGYTDWRVGLALGVAGVVSGLAGAQLALALPEEVLQPLFAAFVVVVAVRLLLKSRPASPREDEAPSA